MKRIKYAAVQAVVLVIAGTVAAFVFNAFSVNGINPFRKTIHVPVIEVEPFEESGVDLPAAIRLIDLDRFRGIVDSTGVVFDARTESEYAEGHVPGAILFDYYEFGKYFEAVAPRLDFESYFAIYCTGPTCEDAELLAKELFTRGYTKLLVFKGGIEKWQEAGLPVEKGL